MVGWRRFNFPAVFKTDVRCVLWFHVDILELLVAYNKGHYTPGKRLHMGQMNAANHSRTQLARDDYVSKTDFAHFLLCEQLKSKIDLPSDLDSSAFHSNCS